MTAPWQLGPEHDGLTLEDRREARKELLARYLAANEGRELKRTLNTVAQWQAGMERAELLPSSARLDHRMNRETAEVERAPLPPVVKRTHEARVDAMIRRLRTLPPQLLESKLQEIAGEFWKMGMPVTGEALRAVAVKYLNRGSQDSMFHRPPTIQATRTKGTGGK